MFIPLYFIVPFVFVILVLAFAFCLKRDIPSWLNINIGRLDKDDIIKLDDRQLNKLRMKVFTFFMLAAVLTGFIGMAFTVLGYSVFICNSIQFTVGMLSLIPIFKEAGDIKSTIGKNNLN